MTSLALNNWAQDGLVTMMLDFTTKATVYMPMLRNYPKNQ